MSLLRPLFICISICILIACTKTPINSNPTALASCTMICLQHLQSCQDKCTNNCPTCSTDSSYTSTRHYLNYAHEKQMQGDFNTRGLNSYRDPLQCRKVSCNCAADFVTCKQGCTGVIQKKLRTVPYCT